jgi:predicted dehydrogenase
VKQVVQSLSSGRIELVDLPVGPPGDHQVLVRTRLSLISPGTERMLLEFGRAGLVGKARQQPERVRGVFEKVRADGALATIEAVRRRLDEPLAPGYCNVGTVLEAGARVREFSPGDRVATNGPHAEIVRVSRNLCALVPDGVSDRAAVFTPLAAVALQGLRLIAPSLGESVAVIGLGVIGLMTVQMLRAAGCRVFGVDPDADRRRRAVEFGAEVCDPAQDDPVAAAGSFSRGEGIDAAVLCASTDSSDPIQWAARMCRQRGRIVLVGTARIEIDRRDFYEKELTFQVSCSYGPGRYQRDYEERGVDYPRGLVRWTARRNFEAALALMAEGRLDPESLITQTLPHGDAASAYDGLDGSLAILLSYPKEPRRDTVVATARPRAEASFRTQEPAAALLGAGVYAGATLLPALARTPIRLRTISSGDALRASHLGRKYGFEQVSADHTAAIADPETSVVFIATRHDSHARLVRMALERGRDVFVEKPLCLSRAELEDLDGWYRAEPNRPRLMIGFNRRFAPLLVLARRLLAEVRSPLVLDYFVNAGRLPREHWLRDPSVGGGRIVGEGCHFVDVAHFLCGTPDSVVARATDPEGDSFAATIHYRGGSLATIVYAADGSRVFPKERLTIAGGGRVLELENFRSLRGYGWKGFSSKRLLKQDKGHSVELQSWTEALRQGKPSPIAMEEIVATMETCFAIREQIAAAT